ncbi:alpha/beta fold hydrolase [Ramlibacter sp. MAHUQ-53]|uniref:alpha/beta fold hydrolase n=1 Tax=unclassified Ramlibacter TaxID=2617605 RepID=UPI00363DE8CC
MEPQADHLLAGTPSHPMHVAFVPPAATSGTRRLPVVMLHGGFHTGAAYLAPPDGGTGWAARFARRGHPVHVPDWPGHGQSPGFERLADLGTEDIARSLAALLATTGPALLVAHSAAGPLAWWLAENHPAQVAAIIGIAPGPSAELLPALPDDPQALAALRDDESAGCPVYARPGEPVRVDRDFIRAFWASSPRFPQQAFEAYAATVVPESPRLLNERFNIGGRGLKLRAPSRVGERPVLVVTGEHDHRHPRATDEALARHLGASFLWLPDIGIRGNGHMLMLEDNREAIADALVAWLESRGL